MTVDFRKHMTVKPVSPLGWVSVLSAAILMAVFFKLASDFVKPAPINVKLPRAVTSDVLNGRDLAILVTGEDIIYIDGKVVTLKEIREFLLLADNRKKSVLIKADRRASVGRLVDIWDLARGVGVERINVATAQEE